MEYELLEEQQDHLNKARVKQSFNAAAESYDEVAELQRQVGEQLVERLQYVKQSFSSIIDIGSGTGYCHNLLRQQYPGAFYYSLDLAHAMLQKAKQKQPFYRRWLRTQCAYVCADTECLPIADNSVELIFSNLTLQWMNDPQKTYQELYRILKPGGLLMFTSLGPDTLKELRQSWRAADDNVRVHPFIDMHHVGVMLLGAKFNVPVLDVEYYTLQFESVSGLMRELKNLGAHNAQTQQGAGLTGKSKLQKMQQAYEQFRVDGNLPATYEVVFGHAWKREARSGDVNVSFS